MKNKPFLEPELVTFLVGKAAGEHSRIHCHLENFFLGIDRNCSMWLLVVVHSTQDYYKLKCPALFKPEGVKYLSGGERPRGTYKKTNATWRSSSLELTETVQCGFL